MALFGQVLTAMITPFTADGALNIDEAVRLARWLEANGNDGLVVSGTTGESSTLTDSEKLELWDAVIKAVSIPVIAGSGSNDTAHSVHLTKEVTALGAAGILAVGPYYNRPSQAGIDAHFRHVAGCTELPVIVYDIPVRTGRKISSELIGRFAREIPNVVGLKDAAGDPAATAEVIAAAPEGFEVYSGDDGLTLPLLAVGAVGVIGVATHWAAPVMRDMIAAHQRGDITTARALNARMLESYAFETGDLNPNPVPTKAMMRALGQPAGPCRPPMGFGPADLEARALAVHERLYA
ncbi:MAG: 4-hydroxy-tetrahydrodipicolinate synthase [Actinobacteria bacterium]|nr:4-hydroxy-tetrahydrodipicolinate synthase [Actinomycetota bacterium]